MLDPCLTGADDCTALVYAYAPGRPISSFGSGDPPSVENWKLLHHFRGHSNNVQGLAWSPDCRMLATCSVDNLVLVMDVHTGQQVARLTGHTGWVKGLAWDPIGR